MKKVLISSFFLFFALRVMADTNVTNTYIENPDFEARFAGWDNNGFYYSTNSSFTRKHGKVYMERWVKSGSKIPNVEISQDLYLPDARTSSNPAIYLNAKEPYFMQTA